MVCLQKQNVFEHKPFTNHSRKLPEDFPNLPEIANSVLKFPEAFFQLPGFTGLVTQRGRGGDQVPPAQDGLVHEP